MRHIDQFEQMTKDVKLGSKDRSAAERLQSELETLALDIERQRNVDEGQEPELKDKGENSPSPG